MATKNELLAQVRQALGNAVTASLTRRARAADIFEAYIWSLITSAAKREGAVIRLQNLKKKPASARQYVFRTSPASIYSGSYSYATLTFDDLPVLEAHIGIYVAGKSGVAHEADVAVVYQSEAELCRKKQVHPRASRVVVSVECKFYSSNLGINLARSFMGLTAELQVADRHFVSNTTSETVARMLTHHDRQWELGVQPSAKRIHERLRGTFETAFKHFKTRKST